MSTTGNDVTLPVCTRVSASNSSSKRAEAAGEDDERLGVLHEHRLAREEVAEVDADVDPVVHALLEGQLDAEARPTRPPASQAPLVGGLHDPGPSAGDDRVPARASPARDLPGQRRTPPVAAWCAPSRRSLTAGPSSASAPKPSTNSAWMRSTRHGSVCTQSLGPRVSSSRWSVVVRGDLRAAQRDRAATRLRAVAVGPRRTKPFMPARVGAPCVRHLASRLGLRES